MKEISKSRLWVYSHFCLRHRSELRGNQSEVPGSCVNLIRFIRSNLILSLSLISPYSDGPATSAGDSDELFDTELAVSLLLFFLVGL